MTARYDASSRYSVDTAGQTTSRGAVVKRPRYTVHTVRQGETMDIIASQHLGNPRRYWEIADMNPQIKFPTDIDVGTVLRLPL